MKRLALLLLALAVSGTAYAATFESPSGFSLAIRSEGWMIGTSAARRKPAGGAGAQIASNRSGISLYPISSGWRTSGPSDSDEQQAPGIAKSGLAEFHLGRLARSEKTVRIVTGVSLLAAGGAGIALGADLVSGSEIEIFDALGKIIGTGFIIVGGAMAIGGIYELAAPSRAEKEYRDAREIADPEQREKACRLLLPELADKGRRTRIITGVACSALSVLCFAGSGSDETASSIAAGGLLGGIAIYSFVAKSPAEKALRNYNLEAGVNRTTQFAFGVGPRGRLQATFLVTY